MRSAGLGTIVVLIVIAGFAPAIAGVADPCANPTMRVSKPNLVTEGGPGNDVILGTDGADQIDGNGGNDVICGRGGAGSLDGDGGSDRVYGGPGNDIVAPGIEDLASTADDWVYGQGGNDSFERGRNPLNGPVTVDHCYGGRGTDRSGDGVCEAETSIERHL